MHCYGITWLLHVVTHFGFRMVKSQKLQQVSHCFPLLFGERQLFRGPRSS